MEYIGITESDKELIAAATAIIQKNFLLGKHHIGAAVRAKSGQIYAGVHLDSKNVDTCAEQVALGMAASAGEREFDSIVAITMRAVPEPTIISPCQNCLELINFYGPDTWVILTIDGELQKCRVKELLPVRSQKARGLDGV